jgi:hypothetical protein
MATSIGTLLVGGALAIGGALGAGQDGSARGTAAEAGSSQAAVVTDAPSRIALVIDASRARDGRELVDPRLRDVDADVRLPRTPEEARTNVRYFDALGYRVVVAGPQASAAAWATGVEAERAPDLRHALQAAPR